MTLYNCPQKVFTFSVCVCRKPAQLLVFSLLVVLRVFAFEPSTLPPSAAGKANSIPPRPCPPPLLTLFFFCPRAFCSAFFCRRPLPFVSVQTPRYLSHACPCPPWGFFFSTPPGQVTFSSRICLFFLTGRFDHPTLPIRVR